MASPEDLAFGQIAVERKLVTAAQVAECLELQEKMRALGVYPKSVSDLLLDKGYLSQYLVKAIYREQGKDSSFPKVEGYEIEAKIGHGGMGTVFRAKQKSLDRTVAIKVLVANLARDRTFVSRFLREARAVAALNHENIIVGIDVGRSHGAYYFVMEYVEGETVQDMLRDAGRLPEARALDIVRQISLALTHAHEHGLVHRDVKPANIMVTAEGTAKLCDLGLAKSVHQDHSLTQSGATHGTPHYMSPEQARGAAEVDIRSDIYSLGATLYHMVVGEVPFNGSSAAVILLKHLSESVPSPRTRRPELSEGICHLIETMMAKKAEARYQTPAALLEDIERVRRGTVPSARRPAVGESSVRHPGETGYDMPPAGPHEPATGATVPPASAAAPASATVLLAGGAAGGALLALVVANLVWNRPGVTPPGPATTAVSGTAPPTTTRTTTPPVTVPPVEPDAEALRRAGEAKAWVDEITTQAGRVEKDHRRLLAAIAKVQRDYAGVPIVLRLAPLAASVRKEWEALATRALDEAKPAVARSIAEEHYQAALNRLEALADLFAGEGDVAGTVAGATAQADADAIRLRLPLLLHEVETAAAEDEATGDLESAMRAWQRASQWGDPGILARAQAELERLRGLLGLRRAVAEEEAQRKAWTDHREALAALGDVLAAREYDTALAKMESWRGVAMPEAVRERIERDRALVVAARKLFVAAGEALRTAKSVTLRKRGTQLVISGEMRELKDGICTVEKDRVSGARMRVALADLAAEDIFQWGGAGEGGLARLARGALWWCDGDGDAALSEFQRAADLGERAAAAHLADNDERLADMLVRTVRSDWSRREFEAARTRLERLVQRFARTRTFSDHEEEIEGRAARVEALAAQVGAAREAAKPNGRKLLGPDVVLTIADDDVGGGRRVTAAAEFALATSPGERKNVTPSPAWLFVGSAGAAPAWRDARGAHGAPGTAIAFRPLLDGDAPIRVELLFEAAQGASGTLCLVGDPVGTGTARALRIVLGAAGGVLTLAEGDAGELRELIRFDGQTLADGRPHRITLEVDGGRARMGVDDGPLRPAALARVPDGHVVLGGLGDAVGYRALQVRGVVAADWLLRDPWVRAQLEEK